MVQPVLAVKDRNNVDVSVFTINPNGQALAADSQPVTIASNQPALAVTQEQLPVALGTQPAVGSLSVTPASDALFVPAIGAAIGVSTISSSAYEASRVLKASAGTLVALIGYNSKTAAQWIQLFNAAAVPADASVPIATFIVPAQSNFSLSVPISGLPLSTGIVVCNSLTGPTKTLGSADCFFTAVIK